MKKLMSTLFATALLGSAALAYADNSTNDTTNTYTPTSQDTQKLHQIPEGQPPVDSTTTHQQHKKDIKNADKDMNVQKLRQKPDETPETHNHKSETTTN